MSVTGEDTIAAIATAPGAAGISVIRISGRDALAVADRVVKTGGRKPSERRGFTFFHARMVDGSGSVVDDGLVLIMRGPRSYTGEDVVELQGHGGDVQARRLLRCALEAGARPADPGEFTRRAFVNGRMDLTQAEAVLDVIRARSDAAAASAMEQLQGGLSTRIDGMYEGLIGVSADLEATLDFPEDELPEAVMGEVRGRLDKVWHDLEGLLSTWTEGRLLREGAAVVIAGRPNVGKSTLLNGLLGLERAIVADVPGTTRDTIEETLVLDGIPIRLIDTAGLREADCVIEREGIRRSREQLERADLFLYVYPAPEGLTEEDRVALGRMDGRRLVLVANKCDLGMEGEGEGAIAASLVRGEGLAEIRERMLACLRGGEGRSREHHAAISERHRHLLERARGELAAARELLATVGEEARQALACDHLSHGLDALAEVTGRSVHHDLLDAIFSRFCIGK
ncbi:MAG TPA: tRNA uridine-5-carboxymethylaminomethyl(34) synthesis GTPase MnmE [Kiritimatiellia bacterium]|nr:tRNA uridine-5-carboxymethylaminomethyl(34) synthesis GTPase MnmE [Kiritimatiellia bacterium]